MVISVLATITVVSFNGIQTRALNAARSQEAQDWVKIFEIYKVANGSYPVLSNGKYCLGENFPDYDSDGTQDCHDTDYAPYRSHPNAALNTELRTVSSVLPNSSRKPVGNSLGPFVDYGATTINILTILDGGPNDCPADFVRNYHDGNRKLLCGKLLQK